MENSDEKPFHSSVDFRVLGKKIQKTRKAKGIRQAELADRLDISYQYMSMIENGRRQVSLPLLVQIANELSVPTDLLLSDFLEVLQEKK